jgi:uncharacterized protein (TIGR02117 family)
VPARGSPRETHHRLNRNAVRASARALLALLLAGCAGQPLPPPGNAATIIVVDRGWHTDISLPADRLDDRFDALRARFPGARAFTFGFGERLFVQKRDRTVLDALRALLPSAGMVLVTALNTSPAAAFGPDEAIPLAVSADGFAAVTDFVRRSISDDAAGAPDFVGDGPYPGSAFYASTLTYDGLFTCNTWTAEALRAGGVPVTADAVLFASQLTGQVRWRAVR